MKQEAEKWYKKGSYASESGNFDEAVTAFKQAVALDPDNEDARINLRHAYGKKNDLPCETATNCCTLK